jgi:ribosomal protein S18 acetylase RimI-like enzyme
MTGEATRAVDGALESEPPSSAVSEIDAAPGASAITVPVAREEFVARRRTSDPRAVADSRGTGIFLRELTPADRARVGEILRTSRVFSREEIAVAMEVFDEGTASGGARSEEKALRPLSPLPHSSILDQDYLLLGAFTPENVLIGYACWGPTPATDRTWDLYWIAVDSALQGAGIGTILMEEIERRLAGQRARLIVVETSSRHDYAPTRAFYARRGYAEAARVRDFYAPGDDRIIFVKRFHPHTPRGGAQGRDE